MNIQDGTPFHHILKATNEVFGVQINSLLESILDYVNFVEAL